MQELILHIDYLLRRHGCVTVPGIGAFIASVQSAYIDSDGAIRPPCRILVFNPAINHNDGLLSASYARRRRCGNGEADVALAADIDGLRAALTAGEQIDVAGRGILRYNGTSVIFEASPADSWLPVLHLSGIMQMARDESDSGHTDSDTRGERIATYLRRIKIAASVAVILALGFVLSTPTTIDNAQFASPVVEQFTPKKPQSSTLLRQPGMQYGTLQIDSTPDTTAVLTADTAAIAAYKAENIRRAKAMSHVAVKPKAASDGRYCLVVASLNSNAEARKFINANNAMKLQILEKDGRYRVYAISGNTIGDVQSQADATGLFDRFPGAWVCRR